MRDRVWISSFGLPFEVRKYRPVLLDSNVLMGIARDDELFHETSQLVRNWKKLRTTSAAFVADFIKLETLNAERYRFSTSTVRAFLREVEKSEEAFYVEVKTPIKEVIADKRGQYMDLLPRSDRNILLKEYPNLSGTDVSLLALSVYLRNSGVNVSLASSDAELAEAAEALDIIFLWKSFL